MRRFKNCIKYLWILTLISLVTYSNGMSISKRKALKEKTKEMIYHAFNGYMKYAFPLDELQPMTCNGKDNPDYKTKYTHGVSDILGNYTLTLIDSLDIFAILGDKESFSEAVENVINTVNFDVDNKVQLFEVNIRILGGLLSAHLFAISDEYGVKLDNYNNELLDLAYDVGKRLLPAFTHSNSEIPLVRVSFKNGVLRQETGSCSACAGSFILEFGTLSRLTGDKRFEEYARKALFKLWEKRSSIDLLGLGINANSTNWDSPLSRVGAGLDSMFEYMLKGYILFGDPDYLKMFKDAYSAIKRYIKNKDGLYLTVNMKTGAPISYNMDGLTAFFPGLLVLMGDIPNAIHLHQIYTELWKKYHAIPESFDFRAKRINHNAYFLRPEYIESSYMLYQATKDPHYLELGEMVLNDIEKYCRTKCGYAQLNPLTSFVKDNRMESFLISESLKYLYLLFDEENIINRQHKNSLFTTEGHYIDLPRTFYNKKHYNDSSYLNANHSNVTCPYIQYNIQRPLLPKKEKIKIFKLVNNIELNEQLLSNFDSTCFVNHS